MVRRMTSSTPGIIPAPWQSPQEHVTISGEIDIQSGPQLRDQLVGVIRRHDEHHVRLRLAALPVREFRSYKGRQHYSGWYW
jgi:hypothetical protein